MATYSSSAGRSTPSNPFFWYDTASNDCPFDFYAVVCLVPSYGKEKIVTVIFYQPHG